jgi:hypothetical protein
MAVLADWAHPTQPGDGIGLRCHAGDAHSAKHLGHGQDEHFYDGHLCLQV